jgi:hypothetical protein
MAALAQWTVLISSCWVQNGGCGLLQNGALRAARPAGAALAWLSRLHVPRARVQLVGDEEARTTRMPLGAVFNKERTYLFRVGKNMRSYEWTREEVENMWEDINEAMEDQSGDAPHHKEDYELNQIIITKVAKAAADGNGIVYELWDGQQRIVSLCLLFCAIRDRLRELARDETLSDETREVCDGEAEETALMLHPVSKLRRHADVLRVQLRQADSAYFSRLINSSSVDAVSSEASLKSTRQRAARMHANFEFSPLDRGGDRRKTRARVRHVRPGVEALT